MGGFSKQDLGEIATVIWARDSRSSAIVDDGLARDLARRWSVAYSRTHSVVTAMVKAAHLSKAEAWAVWQDCWTHPDRRKFDSAFK